MKGEKRVRKRDRPIKSHSRGAKSLWKTLGSKGHIEKLS
jgi:hypothetical protein